MGAAGQSLKEHFGFMKNKWPELLSTFFSQAIKSRRLFLAPILMAGRLELKNKSRDDLSHKEAISRLRLARDSRHVDLG